MSKPVKNETPSKLKKMMEDIDDKESDLYKSLSDKQKALLGKKTVLK